MKPYKSYKDTHPFEKRRNKCKATMDQDPDKFIMISERHPLSKLPDLTNPKMLCPKSYKYGTMKGIIENKIRLMMGKAEGGDSKESLFVYIGKHLPSLEETLGPIYEKFKDPDGILYVTYQELESF